MTLSLSVRETEDLYVGDVQYVVAENFEGDACVLKRSDDGETFYISDTKATEIADNVFVSAGRKRQKSTIRLAIDAPVTIPVMRGARYRSMPEKTDGPIS